MMRVFIPLLFVMLISKTGIAQEWSLKLSSNVELRTWKLTSRAEKKEKSLEGATITLLKGTSLIGSTTTDPNGDFVIDVPAHGDFILTVAYQGCNTKKFYVSTNGVPENVGKDNYKPTVMIGGFIMSKPISGVDYIGLNEPLVKVEYKSNGQNFDKDETVTNNGLNIVSKISASENTIIKKFCDNNKSGDEALNKKKCDLAKQYYTKARNLIPDEQYPVEQLVKVEECLNEKKVAAELAAQEAARKAEAAKLAKEKAANEKKNLQKAAASKTVSTKETNSTQTKTSSAAQQNNSGANDVIKAKPVKPAENGTKVNRGKSKYKVKHVLGRDYYKETIIRADDYFKTKRYKEARTTYEKALTYKEKDAYATGMITKCDIKLKESAKEQHNKK